MARIIHINCPKCGGTLGMAGMERIVKCRYCGSWALVDAPDMTPEYYVKPTMNETDARRSIQRLLMDEALPEGMLKRSRFHSARLCFIPYHELYGRRLGTMTTTQYEQQRRLTRHVEAGPQGSTITSYNMEYRDAPKQKTVDTRVIMADVIRLEPAIRLGEWGLEESDLESLRSDAAGSLHPVNRRDMERAGKVYDPTVSVEQLLSTLQSKGYTAWLDDNTEIAEVKIKRIYYPVWRIRYRYQGRLYGATLDAVTGKLMAARAPQNDRFRVFWLLGTSALVSLVAGKIGRGVVALGGAVVSSGGDLPFLPRLGAGAFYAAEILVPVMLLGLAGAFVVLGVGWEQFRYQGELVFRGGKRTVEKIGRPAKTWFDKASEKMSRISVDLFKAALSQRRRGL